jgi:adenylate cyclase
MDWAARGYDRRARWCTKAKTASAVGDCLMTTEDTKTDIELPQPTPAIESKAPRPGTPEPKAEARWRMLRRIGGVVAGFAAVGTVLAGLIGYWTTYRTVTSEIFGPLRPAPTAPRLSIAVLPFSNLTGDAAQDYLGDVITEELTTSLARIPHSFVIARSTAFTYKGKAVDVRQLGRDLGVRYVLEGSQELGGNRVRVNAQLIDTNTGAHLWADQFDADRTNLLDMQDEIVTRLSRALQIRLLEVEAAHIARAHPADMDANQLAMRCEAMLLNSQPGSAEAEEGYSLCERALERDDRNVRALISLSFKFIDRTLTVQSLDRDADIRRADEMVSKALAIDPNVYSVHFAKAEILVAQGRFDEAIVEAERSLALNPSFVSAYGALATASSFLGRPQDAIDYADKAMRLSPRDPFLYVFYLEKGFALSLLHHDDQAIDWLRRAAAAAPQWPLPQALLAAELSLTGHDVEARDVLKRYLSLSATTAKTIAQWRGQLPSNDPVFLAYAAGLIEGLRNAGLPE